jgi:hypothetical protein
MSFVKIIALKKLLTKYNKSDYVFSIQPLSSIFDFLLLMLAAFSKRNLWGSQQSAARFIHCHKKLP